MMPYCRQLDADAEFRSLLFSLYFRRCGAAAMRFFFFSLKSALIDADAFAAIFAGAAPPHYTHIHYAAPAAARHDRYRISTPMSID